MTKTCTRCVYDENIPGISFDMDGVCNYCKLHDDMCKKYPIGKKGQQMLENLAKNIKREGRNKEYDCIIGVSGGCDSSYMLHLAKELELRPLAVHFDNTWNSTIATRNIHTMLKKLNIDLYTHVVNNYEFNDICKSFLKASVPEVDAATDIGLITTLYMAADKYKIKYILDGHSFRTEGITPSNFFYFDGKYIDSIQKQFGTYKLETFPNLWLSRWLKWLLLNRIKRPRPLYYIDYHKGKVKELLTKEYGWKWYGGHHMENWWTIFCDNYYLPKKFNRDLRYVEFSALIRSGQMTREDAFRELEKPPPVDKEILEEVKKRLDFTDEEFTKVMNLPKKTYKDYATYQPIFRRMRPFFWLMYKMNLVPKSFYVKYCK